MSQKKPAKAKGSGRGRPKAAKPLKSLLSIKGTDDFEAWIDGLAEHCHLGTRSLAIRNSLRVFAEQQGYDKELPKR